MPRLQLLHWTTARTSLPWLRHLLSPTLSVINLDFIGGHGSPVNVAIIKALPITNLKRVAFSALRNNAEVDGALLDLVLNSKRLESISIQQEMPAGEISLSTSDKFEGKRGPIELESIKSIKVAFKSEPTFLPSLFNRTTFPNIHEIYIKHVGNNDWSECDDLFVSVLRSAAPGGLLALRYTSIYNGIDVTSTEIRSLQRFVALRSLRVESLCTAARCKFFLCDDDVSAIATSMPNLVELYLGGPPCMSAVNVSIDGLTALAANCTKLTELQIHFDTARFINKALDISGQRTPPPLSAKDPCQLSLLIVGKMPLRSGVDGSWIIGVALLQIFPNLKNIKCLQQHMSLYNEWGDVMKAIKVQRNVASFMAVR